MSKIRRNHAPQFKAKVVIEALAGEKTIHEIAAKHQVHPNQVTQWRRQLIDQAATLFGKGAPGAEPTGDRDVLLAKIGQLTVVTLQHFNGHLVNRKPSHTILSNSVGDI
ncbi:MAG TPA: transposase [Acidiferrobacter sp.]|nr:transposase [Acidiferrobacter sp.]